MSCSKDASFDSIDKGTDETSEPELPGEDTEDSSSGEVFYQPTEEESQGMCRAFTLLDVDGDGVLDQEDLEKLLVSWGRMPMDDELEKIMLYAKGTGCEGEKGMTFEEFQRYLMKELENTRDEEELREAFRVFDSQPPTGKLNVTELRHYLKHEGMKLTDDEIDFLYREEDYWMLEEKSMFDYEQIINKIMEKPTCKSQFLHC